MNRTLILPGIGNSGPDHWQTRWERMSTEFHRVEQDEWDAPHCTEWVQRLNEVIETSTGPIVLAGHSSACALIAHWAVQASPAQQTKVTGALLVAPSDPLGSHYPKGPTGFAPVPMERLPFSSIVVASTDDPYVTLDTAKEYAAAWNSRMVVLEGAGHINAASGLGDWPEGMKLLKELHDAS